MRQSLRLPSRPKAASIRGLAFSPAVQARSLASGVLSGPRKHRRADRLLPASGTGAAYRRAVHKHVDDLCATALSLCTHSGNAGDSAGWLRPNRAFTWESASHTLCTDRKLELSTCRAAISDK